MQPLRYTKQLLYKEVDAFKKFAGIDNMKYPLDTIKLAEAGGLSVDFHKFKTKGLKGTLVITDSIGCIILNDAEGTNEKNFFAGHELIHFVLHRDVSGATFQCFDRVKPKQNSILEWQANEGAAQLIVPYQDFIPRFVECLNQNKRNFWIQGYLADYYNVTPRVISNRLESLSYEIDQYRCGISLNNLEILSRNQRMQRGIKTTCYEAMCEFPLDWGSFIG